MVEHATTFADTHHAQQRELTRKGRVRCLLTLALESNKYPTCTIGEARSLQSAIVAVLRSPMLQVCCLDLVISYVCSIATSGDRVLHTKRNPIWRLGSKGVWLCSRRLCFSPLPGSFCSGFVICRPIVHVNSYEAQLILDARHDKAVAQAQHTSARSLHCWTNIL